MPAAILEMFEQFRALLGRQYLGGIEQGGCQLARGLVGRGDTFGAQLLRRLAVDGCGAKQLGDIVSRVAEAAHDRADIVMELVHDRLQLLFLLGCGVDLLEHALEAVLAENAGRTLSREQLMDMVKGEELEAFDRSIDVHVSRIRAAIETDPKHPRRIITVRGAGYVFARFQDGGR